MTIEQFGKRLLETQDLDPVYVALYAIRGQLSEEKMARLLIAYWCFYHLGVAATIADLPATGYWDNMYVAALNGDRSWPRGSERRHFRALNAERSVRDLRQLSPKAIVDHWLPKGGSTFASVAKRVQEFTGFGPWIAFKIADMGERVLGRRVDFSDCHFGVYKDPRQGAAIARFGFDNARDMKYDIEYDELRATFVNFTLRFNSYSAPPDRKRRVNVQEVETIFCKYKSYCKGHYPLGKDTKEVAHILNSGDWGKTAAALAAPINQLVRAHWS